MKLFTAIALGCLLLATGSKDETAAKRHPVAVNYFLQGDTLMPSYACPDTLIVIDAVGLNKSFAYVEQQMDWGTDADIDSLLHQHCLPIGELGEHTGEFETKGFFNPLTAMLP